MGLFSIVYSFENNDLLAESIIIVKGLLKIGFRIEDEDVNE